MLPSDGNPCHDHYGSSRVMRGSSGLKRGEERKVRLQRDDVARLIGSEQSTTLELLKDESIQGE
jgi:hypothetical protein